MEKRIKITQEENDNVYNLYTSHISYLNILQFLINNGPVQDKELYDKKWDEAIALNIKLDEAKRAIEQKYKPAGDWERYEFDFNNQQVVFIKNET